MIQKLKNLQDLKKFINSIPEELLHKELNFWSETSSGKIIGVELLQEEIIDDDSGEGLFHISCYDSKDLENMKYSIVYDKKDVLFSIRTNEEIEIDESLNLSF